ncbi:uncharacterized protein LOC116848271 [Odontomachus brunneus]|uniref:uncharacterized protein LOC116848271 n=1 Tax=Odontomachus brunneus TaxID=486640 RepID=UPI0013F1BD79|nr:uncharacterized protein LOC116848271 [Odontomachus brunneus]
MGKLVLRYRLRGLAKAKAPRIATVESIPERDSRQLEMNELREIYNNNNINNNNNNNHHYHHYHHHHPPPSPPTTITTTSTQWQSSRRLLGDFLGVTDYETNKAAFWFLDTIALQVLRYRDNLDDHYRSVLISWLAGEMKLIRDKKLLREYFFEEMRTLFLRVAEKISAGDQLLHWELLIDECSNVLPDHLAIDESAASGAKYLITNKLPEELATEDAERASRENQLSSAQENLQDRNHRNRHKKGSSLPSLSRYANELRYALVYAVFVTQIEMHTFYMPRTFRVPREIKLAEAPFDVQLRERLEKRAVELTTGIRNGKRQTRTTIRINNQTIDELKATAPRTPPSSLHEDEVLADNRRFILPLIEAKEAAQIFETLTGNM